MSKAFTKETDSEDNEPDEADALPAGQKNYMTPQGFAVAEEEFKLCFTANGRKSSRSFHGPPVMATVRRMAIISMAKTPARNRPPRALSDQKDRKRRNRRSRTAEKPGPGLFRRDGDLHREDGAEQTLLWSASTRPSLRRARSAGFRLSPRALMKAHVGDTVELRTPSGPNTIEVLAIRYGMEE